MTYSESTQKTGVNFPFIKDLVQWMQIEIEMENETLALLACTSEFGSVGHFVKTENMCGLSIIHTLHTYITYIFLQDCV